MRKEIKQLRLLAELYAVASEYDYVPAKEDVSEDYFVDGMDSYEECSMDNLVEKIINEIDNLPLIT